MQDFEEYEEFDLEDEEEGMAALDAFIAACGLEPTHGIFVLDPKRVMQMQFAYNIITEILRKSGDDAEIICEQSKDEPHMGYITVRGVSIEILDTAGFSEACKFADNTDIYPLVKNKICMDLTFHGIAVRAEEFDG